MVNSNYGSIMHRFEIGLFAFEKYRNLETRIRSIQGDWKWYNLL